MTGGHQAAFRLHRSTIRANGSEPILTLSTGTRLGAYEILSPLGAGGMGEVYRARDSKLGRDVAIKVLPDTFSRDPERLARFEREARMLRTVRSGPFADNHHVAYSLGAALAQLGERDDALRFLRRAVDAGFPCYPFFEVDPLLQPLRNDAGFQNFMAGLRASYESARTTYSKNPTPSPAQSP